LGEGHLGFRERQPNGSMRHPHIPEKQGATVIAESAVPENGSSGWANGRSEASRE
jgi:hypothetical protein